MNIHPTALVADSAVLADDVEVGPYSIIGDHVEIGAGCRIDTRSCSSTELLPVSWVSRSLR